MTVMGRHKEVKHKPTFKAKTSTPVRKRATLAEIKNYAHLAILAIARYAGELYYDFPIPDGLDSVEQAEFERFLESYKFIAYLITQIQQRLLILKLKKANYTQNERKELFYEFSTIRYVSGIVIMLDGTVIADYSTIGNQKIEPVKDLSDNVSIMQDYVKENFKTYSDIKHAKQIQRLQELYNRVVNLAISSFLLSNDSYLVFNEQDWTARAIVTSKAIQQNVVFMLSYLNATTIHPFTDICESSQNKLSDFEYIFQYELQMLNSDIDILTNKNKDPQQTEELHKRFANYCTYLKMSKKQEIELIQEYQKKTEE